MMKRHVPPAALFARTILATVEFTPGGVSVDLNSKVRRSAPASSPEKNYVLKGSLEEPGTTP